MTMAATCIQDSRPILTLALWAAAATVIVAVSIPAAHGADAKVAQQVEREVIPGAERMTDAERDVYRRRMQSAVTPAEKAKIRAEYSAAATAAAPEPLRGDPARGSKLHSACFGCHGIERYTQPMTYVMATFSDSLLRASGLSDMPAVEPARFKGRIQSLTSLRDAVTRRNEFFSPKMTPQEVEDVVAYLNVTYYKFPQ